MTNLIDIQSQIDKLQKQAAEIKTRDFDKTVAEILIKMQVFGITVKDLAATRKSRTKNKVPTQVGASSKAGTTAALRRTVVVAAKFKGPNGETWSGRGKTPRWLAAFLAQGRLSEEFSVKG